MHHKNEKMMSITCENVIKVLSKLTYENDISNLKH